MTSDSVITPTNYHEKMPAFDPSSNNHLYGLVDMGSNGIRFSISDLSPPRSRLLRCIYRDRADISLYDALHEVGSTPLYFSRTTIDLVSTTLAGFKEICERYTVPNHQIQVFATEAMRTSRNRDEIFAAIWEKSGMRVDILSPQAESLFGSLGARSGFTSVQGLFMDLGGGSVQMTYLDTQVEGYEVFAAEAAMSIPFGAAKLSNALEYEDKNATIQELNMSMRDMWSHMTTRFPALKVQAASKQGIHIYMCGGGFRGYGSMLMHTSGIQTHPIPEFGGYSVDGERFIRYKHLVKVNKKEKGKIEGMSKRRRKQFPAIAKVIASVVECVPKIGTVTFCAGGNREGVLFMKLDSETRRQSVGAS